MRERDIFFELKLITVGRGSLIDKRQVLLF